MLNRLVIYFHYDPRGQADTACRFAVHAMGKQARVLLFVHNGPLARETRDWLAREGVEYLERQNTGMDVGAYRDALFHLGRKALDSFEELILMNYTLAGPVRPLESMFAAMDARPELDFWGISRHYAMRSRRFGKNGFVPEHIQSHFIAVRRHMYDDFWQYWQNMQLPASYEDSIRCHETRFTRHFADLGYRWDTFVDGDAWRGLFVNPIMACPRELIAGQGCPFFKRRSFFTPYADELRRTDGCGAARLYTYLKRNTDFPADELIASLLPNQPLTCMFQNLHWHYLLPEASSATVPVTLLLQNLRDGIQLQKDTLYWIPLEFFRDGVLHWYEQAYRWDESRLAAVAALFDAHPGLGVAGPALPSSPDALEVKERKWKQDLPHLKESMASLGLGVPLSDEPLPLPNGGGLMVRGAAFPGGLPPVRCSADFWLLPLTAQQNGYFSADVAEAEQAAAVSDIRQAAARPLLTIPGTTKMLARRIKHTLLSRKEINE